MSVTIQVQDCDRRLCKIELPWKDRTLSAASTGQCTQYRVRRSYKQKSRSTECMMSRNDMHWQLC